MLLHGTAQVGIKPGSVLPDCGSTHTPECVCLVAELTSLTWPIQSLGLVGLHVWAAEATSCGLFGAPPRTQAGSGVEKFIAIGEDVT